MSQISKEKESELALLADLLTIDFRNMYVRWGSNTPVRTGMHASAILQPESEWCVREQVLLDLFPEQVEKAEWESWQWRTSAIFENGWDLHKRWQRVFEKFAKIVYTPVFGGIAYAQMPPASDDGNDLIELAPELDLTHYDHKRNIYFSPDAIIKFGQEQYVIEIKGIKEQSYLELTGDLDQACASCQTVDKARKQANLYMHLLGLKRAIILVENKNTCDFRLWVIEYHQEMAWPYTDRMNQVRGKIILARKQGLDKLPQRICQSASDPRAQRCPLRSACFSNS